jgi:mannose-6-phosphate isomerase-like protein (cupin superfamily)
MGIQVTRLADAKAFDPPGHRGVGPVRLQGGDGSPESAVTVTLSHYLPGGEAEMAPQPAETVYVLLAGELVMVTEEAEETLRPYDSVRFTAGTRRQVVNRTHLPASMLVIRPANSAADPDRNPSTHAAGGTSAQRR